MTDKIDIFETKYASVLIEWLSLVKERDNEKLNKFENSVDKNILNTYMKYHPTSQDYSFSFQYSDLAPDYTDENVREESEYKRQYFRRDLIGQYLYDLLISNDIKNFEKIAKSKEFEELSDYARLFVLTYILDSFDDETSFLSIFGKEKGIMYLNLLFDNDNIDDEAFKDEFKYKSKSRY